MKKFLPIMVLSLCSTAFASEIDYSHCQQKAYGPSGYLLQQAAPFTIESDGKITPHASVNSYEFDKSTNTEVLKIVHENFGMKSENQIHIKRNERGEISQIIHKNESKARPTRSGMGSQMPQPLGFGGMYGMGGMYGSSDISMTTVTDIKIENGKCFPYRSYMDTKNGNHLHRSLIEEAQLCRDITAHLNEEQKENSKLSELKSCHDAYQNEASKVINAHKERNADLYEVPKSDENPSMFGGGIGGYGYGLGYGGFGMSIDNIVNSAQFSSAEKLKMLTVYCMMPNSPLSEMSGDEKLFEPGPFQPTNPQPSVEGLGSPR